MPRVQTLLASKRYFRSVGLLWKRICQKGGWHSRVESGYRLWKGKRPVPTITLLCLRVVHAKGVVEDSIRGSNHGRRVYLIRDPNARLEVVPVRRDDAGRGICRLSG